MLPPVSVVIAVLGFAQYTSLTDAFMFQTFTVRQSVRQLLPAIQASRGVIPALQTSSSPPSQTSSRSLGSPPQVLRAAHGQVQPMAQAMAGRYIDAQGQRPGVGEVYTLASPTVSSSSGRPVQSMGNSAGSLRGSNVSLVSQRAASQNIRATGQSGVQNIVVRSQIGGQATTNQGIIVNQGDTIQSGGINLAGNIETGIVNDDKINQQATDAVTNQVGFVNTAVTKPGLQVSSLRDVSRAAFSQKEGQNTAVSERRDRIIFNPILINAIEQTRGANEASQTPVLSEVVASQVSEKPKLVSGELSSRPILVNAISSRSREANQTGVQNEVVGSQVSGKRKQPVSGDLSDHLEGVSSTTAFPDVVSTAVPEVALSNAGSEDVLSNAVSEDRPDDRQKGKPDDRQIETSSNDASQYAVSAFTAMGTKVTAQDITSQFGSQFLNGGSLRAR